jgi:hypothetical protein
MIHRLEIENFYSIRETQVIDLRIGAKVPDEQGRFAEINDGSGERVPKTVAFFGANASGKSNVLKALTFLRWFLVDSVNAAPDAMLEYVSFADASGTASPTRLKVHFDWFEDFSNTNLREMEGRPFARYSYELRVINNLRIVDDLERGGIVLSEQLRMHPPSGKSRRIFERTEGGEVKTDSGFSLKRFSQILAKLRKNASLTSTIAQFSEESPVSVFLAWAKRIPSNFHGQKLDLQDNAMVQYYASHPQILADLNQVINRVDLGLSSASFMQLPTGDLGVTFAHNGLDFPLIFQAESEGTKSFVKIFPIIKEALIVGGIAVLDELDSAIHPMLLPEILRWFRDPKDNPRNAQLWFSGHSASLLEELSKEEVFFTEKDQQGRTKVYGLGEIESVRRSDNFYQKYLGGVYGAVPRIG